MDVDIHQLPIPDWGLHCPNCDYLLVGLPEHRCPECGTQLDMEGLCGTWATLRPPRYGGKELPLPDFGLTCRSCGAPLAGCATFHCGVCRRSFDPQRDAPLRPWFTIDSSLAAEIPLALLPIRFAEEEIPFVPEPGKLFRDLALGSRSIGGALRVPRAYYFDVLELLERLRREMRAARELPLGGDWRCARCGENVPAHFETCWNCGVSRPGERSAGDQSPTT